PQPFEPEIEEAFFAQYRDPGIGADQEVSPERQDDQQQQHILQPRWREGYSKCKRETEHEASRGRYRGDHDRFPDDAEVNPLQRASVVVEGELDQSLTFGSPSTEAVDPDDGERDGEEQDQPEARRGH